VPWSGSLADWITLGPASTSVSFVRTSIEFAPESSPTAGESSAATGGSSTRATVTPRSAPSLVEVPGLGPVSVTRKVTVRAARLEFSESLSKVTVRRTDWYCVVVAVPSSVSVPVVASNSQVMPWASMQSSVSWSAGLATFA
jgi:hypothetical protein